VAIAASAALVALLCPARGAAQVTDEPSAAVVPTASSPAAPPDPSKFARGLYTEGEAGAVFFVGPIRSRVETGFALGLRVGYDVTSWLAVQARGLGSTHETKFAGMPQAGQLLQLYQGLAELKATLRFSQTSIFLEGGAGAARLSTNILATVGLTRWRTGLTAGGGAGIDYHSLSRHFSMGLRAGYFWLRDIGGSQDLITTAYVRYTF
jgi:opacity protein-like surface antigen